MTICFLQWRMHAHLQERVCRCMYSIVYLGLYLYGSRISYYLIYYTWYLIYFNSTPNILLRYIAKSNKGTRSNILCVTQCSSDTDIANAFGSKLRCLLNTDISSKSLVNDLASSISSSFRSSCYFCLTYYCL